MGKSVADLQELMNEIKKLEDEIKRLNSKVRMLEMGFNTLRTCISGMFLFFLVIVLLMFLVLLRV